MSDRTIKKIKLSKVDCGIIKINNYVYIYIKSDNLNFSNIYMRNLDKFLILSIISTENLINSSSFN